MGCTLHDVCETLYLVDSNAEGPSSYLFGSIDIYISSIALMGVRDKEKS
jgi:hypothetical protein